MGLGNPAGLRRLPHIRAHVLSSQGQSSPGLPLLSRATAAQIIFLSHEVGDILTVATNREVKTFPGLLLLHSINKNMNGCCLLSIYYVPDTALGDVLVGNLYNIDKGTEALRD